MLVQEINAGDCAQKLAFARNMLQIFEEHDAVIMMSDEAHFHLNGTVNKQNCRYWASENPRALHQRTLHSPNVTVWCAVTKECVIGPYFFEENGVTVTVNSHRFTEMVNNFFIQELHVRGMNTRTAWFQLDGATAHTARASMDLVRALFNNHVISDLAMFRGLHVRPICQHVISSSGAFLSSVCMRVSHVHFRN